MTTYDFLLAKQAILSNAWTDFNLTQFRFWSTFDMNSHIMITYDFLRLNRLQLYRILLLVNFSHELTHIMTTYDFLSAKQMILTNLIWFYFWSTFDMNWVK